MSIIKAKTYIKKAKYQYDESLNQGILTEQTTKHTTKGKGSKMWKRNEMTRKVDLKVKTSFYGSFERVIGHNT